MFMLQRAEQWTTPNIFTSQCWKSLKHREWGCIVFPPFVVIGYLTGWKGKKLSRDCCNWWCHIRHCSCWRATFSWKQFSSLFSKTNDDKRYHLYKLPLSDRSLQEALVNRLDGVCWAWRSELGGEEGVLVFTAICSPFLAVSSHSSCWKCKG